MVRTAGFWATELAILFETGRSLDDDDVDDKWAATGEGVTAGVSPDCAANADEDEDDVDAEPTRDTLMRRTPTAPPVAAADSVVGASSAGAARLAAEASINPADDDDEADADEDETEDADAAMNVAVDAARCGADHAAASLGKSTASVEKVRNATSRPLAA
jgi:hypothetical protein